MMMISEVLESLAVGEQLPDEAPGQLGGVVKRCGTLPSEQVNIRKEVVRTSSTLK